MLTNLQTLAKALGGEVNRSQVLAPGPGHSAIDRSLSVKLDSNAPDGFLVHSFAGDDPLVCRDHVREKAGLEPFKPNGGGRQRASNDAIERALMAAVAGQRRDGNKHRIVAKYDYTDATGVLLYQVLRLEPKSFRQRRPDGKGDWIWELDERRVLYRWPELLKYPDGTVFICEGEKDADRVAGLGDCATTIAAGKWTEECVTALAGRDVIILEDNDNAGRAKALAAAQALHATAKTIRIVSLPDLSDKGDVSDWLDAACREWTEDTRGQKRNEQPRCCWNACRRATEDNPPREGQRISGLLRPFLAYPKKDRLMYDRQDLIWDGKQLRPLSNRRGVLATIEPDETWPGMWRVRLPDGYLTDIVNLSRAKDAAASLALGVLNRHREAA